MRPARSAEPSAHAELLPDCVAETAERGFAQAAQSDQEKAGERIATTMHARRWLIGESGGGPRSGFQSEREEETRDRAERGSAVRGSDQASVAANRTSSRRTGDDI